ncbi:hypothetical protein J5690_06220 [bacterium]|nr:hypothetical protein [bacterium]
MLEIYSDLFGFINAKNTAHARIATGDNVAVKTKPKTMNIALIASNIAVEIKKNGTFGYLINRYKTQSMEAMIDAIASAFSIGSVPNNIGKCGDTCGSIRNEIAQISTDPIKT